MPADLRRMIPVALLGLVGCTGEGPPPGQAEAPGRAPTPEPAPAPAPARVDAPADDGSLRALMTAFAAAAIRGDAPVRKVLFTWTTREQIEALLADSALLTREATAAGERSRFDVALDGEAGPVAALLREPGRRARRFAWPLPWATVMGFEGSGYGDQLVRVELRPEAIVGSFSPGAPWRFFDMEGREVAEADVVAAPRRLAAVYHVAPATAERPGYREYVLVGEAMIASWAIGTAEVRAAIDEDARLLAAAADRIDALRAVAGARCEAEGAAGCPAAELPEGTAEIAAWSGRLIAGPWAGAPAERDALLAELYAACLALPGPAYAPSEARLRAIAERLRALPVEPPSLVVTPDPSATRPVGAGARSPTKRRSKVERDLRQRCRSDPSLVGCTRLHGPDREE